MVDASLDKGFNLMQHHWLVAKLNQGLWAIESERSQTGSETTDKDNGLHFDFSKKNRKVMSCFSEFVSMILYWQFKF